MFSNFCAIQFNQLPTEDEARITSSTQFHHVQALGEIISEHGLAKTIGITALHRHFALHNGECIVQRNEDGLSVSRAEQFDECEQLVPIVFALSETVYCPLEFTLTSQISQQRLFAVDHLLGNQQFRLTIHEYLEKNNLSNTFGFRILEQGEFDYFYGDQVPCEYTCDTTRSSTITPTFSQSSAHDRFVSTWRISTTNRIVTYFNCCP